ncbi:MAG TPA: transketolase C-terminal domain-containing protein [Candidatus Limnocylindrales bacterium]|nr:transketolase C-terminal domain-containing protein [Candidatus Limnocylindrales bacterium]
MSSPEPPMREITYAEGMARGLTEVLEADQRVWLMGQYFFGLTEHRAKTVEIRRRFGDRIWDPPIAEIGYVGTGIGAAISGLRPIVDVATASFIFQAWSQVVNEAANVRYMTGGQTSVPLVIHVNHGLRGRGAAQHSHSPQAALWNTPGIKIMLPSSPRDVRGLIHTAVADDNPVFWADHVKLFDVVGPAPDEPESIPFGVADVKRAGSDVTIVATSLMVVRSLEAAERLAADGVSAEVVDPRTLVPLDRETILASVAKTGRLVVVDEGHRSAGVGSELVALVAEEAFDHLRAPIRRVATPDVPIPFSPALESFVEPTVEKIVAAVRSVLDLGPARPPRRER